MKKMIASILAASLLMFGGCSSTKFFVIDPAKDNVQQGSSFNDEHYVWETWLFSTNQVNEVK
jgi:hypothetical protein